MVWINTCTVIIHQYIGTHKPFWMYRQIQWECKGRGSGDERKRESVYCVCVCVMCVFSLRTSGECVHKRCHTMPCLSAVCLVVGIMLCMLNAIKNDSRIEMRKIEGCWYDVLRCLNWWRDMRNVSLSLFNVIVYCLVDSMLHAISNRFRKSLPSNWTYESRIYLYI